MTGPASDSPQDLAAAYALGALSAEEARRFEAYLATSSAAREEVEEYREVAALLALSGTDARPGEALRARVLSRVAEEKERRLAPPGAAGRAPSLVLRIALAASLLAAVGLGAGMLSLRGRVSALETELSARTRTLAETERRLIEREATLNSILEPGVQLFQLTSSGDPNPAIQLFWDRQRNRAILQGWKLKPLPEGRAYQLWFIKDGKPVPSVTFKPGPTGHASAERIPVPGGGSLSAAAVTVEPESGSPQPTSPIVLVGSLQKS
jgi:anti-sigma-K factor RskA